MDEEVTKISEDYASSPSPPSPPIGKMSISDRRSTLMTQPSSLAFRRQIHGRQSMELQRIMVDKKSWRERVTFAMRFPSTRMIFTLGTSLILVTAVAIIIAFTVVRGQSLENNLLQALSSSVTVRTSLFLQELLGRSILTSLENNRFIMMDPSRFYDIPFMLKYLYVLLQNAPEAIAQVYQTDATGRFVLAGRVGNSSAVYVSFVNVTSGPGEFVRYQYSVTGSCEPLDFNCTYIDQSAFQTSLSYDSVLRPWYLQGSLGKVIWTDIYFFKQTGKPGITGVDAIVSNGRSEFVAAVDISLDTIGIFLRELTAELKSAKVLFVCNNKGLLVACGAGNDSGIQTMCANINGYNNTANSTIPLIVQASHLLNWTTALDQRLFVSTKTQYFATDSITYNGLGWVVVSVLDRSTAADSYVALIEIVGPVVGVVILITSIILTYIITRRVTNSLKGVTKKLVAVSNLDIDPTTRIIESKSYVREVNEIESATTTLLYGLRSFSKYVPQDIVKLLLMNKKEASLGLDDKVISIFFSDIANFTTIAESLTPRELVALLGEYLMEMSDTIQSGGGLVDKYIGDAVMAFWNSPIPIAKHEFAACETAIMCNTRLAELREKWVANGFPVVEARIGIHSGQARVGNIGSKSRFNYTCIGDSVNLASRLEGLGKVYGTSIIISGTVHDKVKEHMHTRLLDVVAVKGKSKAVRIFELVKRKHLASAKEVEGSLLFQRAFESYIRRDFSGAIELFERYLRLVPNDKSAFLHIGNCQKFLKEPPPPKWNGVAKLDEK